MLRKELSDWMDTYLKVDLFEDYGPNGLQVEGKSQIKKVATAVSANIQTIEAAVKKEVDALIVHHGLFWKGDALSIVGTKKQKLQLLLESGISLLAYHLPLDAHQVVGNNWKAARDLGWENLEPFGGIGVKGEFPEQSIEAFFEKLEVYYGHQAAKALGGEKSVRSAALISGGAYREIKAAAKEGVDCFITGNFDEPAWGWAFEEKIHFLALGHSATERVGPQALASYLQRELGLKAEFLDVVNPF
ncbi:MAG: GTP cyclohydrolase 1 type 2 [Chlamydiales bacterium]|nr:GTP cyclohydrolase 1 type 2 [Chlamydiales bacterium]